eukprot:CAMPEP_0113532108 /NCGR_PEP_ID=MMETSP0015_2-20120614/3867_1 /TAXON_ID=2838 /ORGANISM="Odontella" /LENGTH=98 /DNA_ID=CAMNT_0000431015 /DNA_START=172 /DNA_END=468 /DNA_ORIENTATION=+ /assembly_acc=CAM_ASM_000160
MRIFLFSRFLALSAATTIAFALAITAEDAAKGPFIESSSTMVLSSTADQEVSLVRAGEGGGNVRRAERYLKFVGRERLHEELLDVATADSPAQVSFQR